MRLPNSFWSVTDRSRLAVVCDPGELAAQLRARYPQFNVIESPTYLAGIAALANQPARGLLVGVDPNARKLESAVAGLRKAAGSSSRIVLCCRPSGEPAARSVLGSGADDYLIYPPRGEELDEALGLTSPAVAARQASLPLAAATPSWEELTGLAEVMARMGEGQRPLLERLCQWIAGSMRTAHVRITTADECAHVGDPQADAAVVETIMAGGKTLGQILVGGRQKSPFSLTEIEKLRHYGQLIAHLIEASEQQQSWQSLAMIDEVTELPNRRYLLQALSELLQKAGAQRFRVTVLLFDLDGFKHFNDTYGHAAGDEILRDISRLFRQHCRQHDIVARYGGDEFVVVFWDADEPRVPGSKHPTDVLAVLRRAKEAIHSHAFPKLGPEAQGCITISGGLATFPWDAHDAESLIERADEALLQAKRAGKNRIHIVGRQDPVDESAPEEERLAED
ncbi:MAG: GGDEF domain-containing protein [Phycisphaerae bacterium]|nr:GGDEF domain-containing protein [Phycisphaerae bacterium]